MKKNLFVLVVAMATLQFVQAREVITPDEQKLPAKARSFITQHFPQAKVSYVKIENELFKGKKYEVVLTNGVEIDFSNKGEWTEVDCKREQVPAEVIPATVKKYVDSNFSSNFITQIEQNKLGIEVELNNDLSIEFDRKGNFKRLDD